MSAHSATHSKAEQRRYLHWSCVPHWHPNMTLTPITPADRTAVEYVNAKRVALSEGVQIAKHARLSPPDDDLCRPPPPHDDDQAHTDQPFLPPAHLDHPTPAQAPGGQPNPSPDSHPPAHAPLPTPGVGHIRLDLFASLSWDTILSLPGQTVVQVPARYAQTLAAVQYQLIQHIIQANPTHDDSLPYWKAFLMSSWLFLAKDPASREDAAHQFEERLQLWNMGLHEELYDLVREATKPLIRPTRRTRAQHQAQLQAKAQRVTTLAAAKDISRALDTIQPQDPIQVTQHIADNIQATYPIRRDHPEYPGASEHRDMDDDEATFTIMAHVQTALRRMSRLRQPGPLGMRPEHLWALAEHSDYAETFSYLMARIAMGHIHPEALHHLKRGQITPKPKPPDDYRPILLTNILKRIATKALTLSQKDFIHNYTSPRQYGTGLPDGASVLTKLLRTLADENPARCFVSLDIKAAFQAIARDQILHATANHQVFHESFAAWYSRDTMVTHRLAKEDGTYAYIKANQGVDQGDPLSAYAYTQGIEAALKDIDTFLKTLSSTNRVVSYLDDTYLICRSEDVGPAIDYARRRFGALNQELNDAKTKNWSPIPDFHPTLGPSPASLLPAHPQMPRHPPPPIW